MRTAEAGTLVACAIAWLVLAPGCGEGVGDDLVPLARPDRQAFDDEAAPILERRCGSANCHGRDERPFALFAVRQRRRPPRDTFEPSALDTGEVDANFDATLGFLDHADARRTTLIGKALGRGGPGGHRGGAVFEAPSDPQCRALLAWIAGVPR